MVDEIRLYVEGGGDSHYTRSQLRRGFSGFLSDLIEAARKRRMRWQIVACGSREDAYDDFLTALQTHPDAFNVLLVDSEEPLYLNEGSWQHLRRRDHWNPPVTGDERCHLMVRMMEAWLIADPDALADYYGQGFNGNAIPQSRNVEEITRQKITSALRDATRNTQKGEYHKTRHGFDLLTRVNAARVRARASYCNRLFTTLAGIIEQGV